MADYFVANAGLNTNNGLTPETAFKTLARCFAVASAAGGHCFRLANGETTSDDAQLLINNKAYADWVTIEPVTPGAPFTQQATLGSPGGAGAGVVRFLGTTTNVRFRHVALTSVVDAALGVQISACGNLEISDCSVTLTAGTLGRCIYGVGSTGSNWTMRRNTFTTAANHASFFAVDCSASVSLDGLIFEDNIISAPTGCGFMAEWTCPALRFARNHIVVGVTGVYIGKEGGVGNRISNAVVEDNDITAGTGHGLMVNADTAIVRRNRVAGGNFGLVAKWGNGYTIDHNRVSGASASGMTIKGTQNVVFRNNTISVAAGYGICYKIAAPGDVVCTNVQTCNNIYILSGTAGVIDADAGSLAGTISFDRERIRHGGSGSSDVLGTACTKANGLAAIRAAWVANSLPLNDLTTEWRGGVGDDLIPLAGGNCDVGNGDASLGGIGEHDLYGRPRLRVANAVGAVYPQRDDPRNVLLPILKFPTE